MLAFLHLLQHYNIYELLKYLLNGMLERMNDVANYLTCTSFKLYAFYNRAFISIWFYHTYADIHVPNASIKLV